MEITKKLWNTGTALLLVDLQKTAKCKKSETQTRWLCLHKSNQTSYCWIIQRLSFSSFCSLLIPSFSFMLLLLSPSSPTRSVLMTDAVMSVPWIYWNMSLRHDCKGDWLWSLLCSLSVYDRAATVRSYQIVLRKQFLFYRHASSMALWRKILAN